MLTINNTLDGYLKDVEIKGNTIQDSENLADIRSVGDKVEGQELYEIPVLSRGKNLFNKNGIKITSTNCSVTNNNGVLTIQPSSYNGKNYAVCLDVDIKPGTYFYTGKASSSTQFRNGGASGEVVCNLGASTNKVINLVKDIDCIVLNYTAINSGVITYDLNSIQLEEGTKPTPYEPYQEDKLTILSPVQLEKVGDVADRIIEKDGVLGVEKNVETRVLDGESLRVSSLLGDTTGEYIRYHIPTVPVKTINVATINVLSNKLQATSQVIIDTLQQESISSHSGGGVQLKLNKSKGTTVTEINNYLKLNNIIVKYNGSSQFIPLPHSQQVKLRTFANKTNISFGCEIEGTIKAQVPKSLGATVNTHTEQINNLNKELDRVKKLEESTVSTVTTESDFTTVEATSNGYFEDVKLEGKTLVNYISNFNNWSNMGNTTVSEDGASMTINATSWNKGRQISKSLPIGEYIFSINNPNNATIIVQNKTNAKTLLMGNNIDMNIKFSLLEVSEILITCKNTSETGTYVVNNPILTTDKNVNGYFEGLKSVGQSATTSEDGVDEISVESVKGDGNLFDATLDTQTKNGVTFSYDGATGEIVLNGTCTENNTCVMFKYPTKFIEGNTYYLRIFGTTINSPLAHIRVYDDKYVGNNLATTSRGTSIHKSSSTRKMVNTSIRVDSGITFNNFRFKVQLIVNEDRTEYIPHQSDKKRLLYYNEETQSWEKPILREWDSIEKHSDGKYYYHVRSKEGDYVEGDESLNDCITDLTVSVKKLAEEKVYECTNIDLITYANETNYVVESGAIVPKTTLKVHNNISNVVSLLQKKVSLLESNMTKYMITQNRLQLSSTHSADSVTFKVDYTVCSENMSQENYDTDLYNLILNNILVGKDNYDYDHMFNIIMDYASWSQISWDQFDILVGLMDIQHNPPIEEIPTDDEIVEEIPNEIM